LVVDTQDTPLLGIPPGRQLDALVFSGSGRPWRDVMVAGRWVVSGHRHAERDRIARRFQGAMEAIWSAGD
jgi:formimidoylglutamate deiminase